MRYYIYILHSINFDKYYIGYTSNYNKRLLAHNEGKYNTFTSKYRPWCINAIFHVSEKKSEALKIERFIKNQKSRILLQKLCNKNFTPNGVLTQLVRVPHVRD